ncbi:hypothetical protein DLM78_19100 [Leptospira stimsonii]|uniref:Uncharacterized protein n=1 Tax=Leptospira stimsonii TaxID=2202203 RepID=A0A8B3CN84_9LEPT|nr:hypothetical protein DLM78_19100 [Leptospira stimsonii]
MTFQLILCQTILPFYFRTGTSPDPLEMNSILFRKFSNENEVTNSYFRFKPKEWIKVEFASFHKNVRSYRR